MVTAAREGVKGMAQRLEIMIRECVSIEWSKDMVRNIRFSFHVGTNSIAWAQVPD